MDSVYSGFWINYEYGKIDGATLTLPNYYGLILVSFLTLFVQFSGGCFWRTICFVLHQTRATTTPRDGLYHQQQIILRNAVTASNAIWTLFRSAITWKNTVEVPFAHSLPLLVVATLHIASFAAAGLLSSQIASTKAGQALLISTACGYPRQTASVRNWSPRNLTGDDLTIFNAQVLLGRSTATKSLAYVRSCYSNDPEEQVANCNIFIQRNLMGPQSSASTNVKCPFGDDSCITDAVRYDTGPIYANKNLGLNYPLQDDLSFRRVTTCAPVQAEKYATPWRENLTEAYGKQTRTRVRFYEFGKSDIGCAATTPNETTDATTFCISKFMKDYLPGAYSITANTVYTDNDTASDFTPIPSFRVPNTDLTLISIFNKASYFGKIDDALFNAQNATPNKQFFTPTHDLSVLGCTEQYQFCNSATQKCTPLSGLYATKNSVTRGDLALSRHQTATFEVMWGAAWSMVLQWSSRLLRDRVLLAQDWVFTETSTSSSSLPSNQWQRESSNLHNLSLAIFQHRLSQFSAPETFELQPGLNAKDQLDTPTDPALRDLCNRQRTVSTRHYSLSVLGIGIILGIGSVLILLDLCLETICFRLLRSHLQVARRAQWVHTGTLQLHRQALQARGVRGWDTKDEDVPVIQQKGVVFTAMDAKEEWMGGADRDGKTEYRAVVGEVESEGGGGGYAYAGGYR